LNLKKVAIIVLLTLVLSITVTIFNPALALTNDNQKQKAESLLNILSNNNITIVEAFSRLDAHNIVVPQTAETAYTEALAHAEEAASLMNQEKYDEASGEAVKAMQKFEETLRILESTSPAEPTETEATAEEIIGLKTNITRTIEYTERLENLTTKAATSGYNTTAIENRLSEIKRHLENATRQLSAMNLEGAAEELCTAKTLLRNLKESLEGLTNRVKASNTEKYLEAAEIRVSATKENITASANLTTEAKEDAITALNNSEKNLENARDLIENDNVDDAIEELEEAKKWEEESNRAAASVAATPTSVAPTTESFTKAENTESR
jgi:hypothetical protein